MAPAAAPAPTPSGARPSSPELVLGRAQVALQLTIVEPVERWRLEEEDVPETPLHDAIIQTLLLVLKYWAHREARSALVTSNLACRWDPSDARVGTDRILCSSSPRRRRESDSQASASGSLATLRPGWRLRS